MRPVKNPDQEDDSARDVAMPKARSSMPPVISTAPGKRIPMALKAEFVRIAEKPIPGFMTPMLIFKQEV